jgi:hypothetical protein
MFIRHQALHGFVDIGRGGNGLPVLVVDIAGEVENTI